MIETRKENQYSKAVDINAISMVANLKMRRAKIEEGIRKKVNPFTSGYMSGTQAKEYGKQVQALTYL